MSINFNQDLKNVEPEDNSDVENIISCILIVAVFVIGLII